MTVRRLNVVDNRGLAGTGMMEVASLLIDGA